ncbi:MAG: FmdB family transcriptional regulator [Candidatus Rokuibacteriota bacterium]|nr:MAG: FmdB family transcriptional regulator [Candidatus Rokubacteria bacterium]
MPTYEYQCDACQRTFEVRQRITEEPLTRCEACGGTVRRLLSSAPFILKGEGWYVTDYPSEARKKAQDSEKAATKTSPSAEKSSTPSSEAPPSTSSSSASTSTSSKSESSKSESSA